MTRGYVDNDKIINFFSASNICVVPSMYEEPLELTPIEAMLSNVPVIITNSGGMKEYSVNGYSIVIKRGEKFQPDLIDGILKLYSSKDWRISSIKMGKSRAGEFTCEKFYRNFVSLFE